MSKNSQKLTASYPYRIMKRVSIYLTNQIYDDVLRQFQSRTELQNGFVLIVTSENKISPMDGKVFDLVLSKMRLSQNRFDNLQTTIDIPALLKQLQYANRTENRRRILQHLNNMVGVEVKLTWQEGEASFEMLESINDYDTDDIHFCTVSLSPSYIDAMDKEVAGLRFINVSRTIGIRGGIATELAKVLQFHGRVNNDEETFTTAKISHIAICQYLNLDASSVSSLSQIRKSLNQLRQVGYPNYKYYHSQDAWIRAK